MLKLIDVVSEIAMECSSGRFDENRVMLEVTDPGWEKPDYRANSRRWESHVPGGFRSAWRELPLAARLGIFAMAIISADSSEASR